MEDQKEVRINRFAHIFLLLNHWIEKMSFLLRKIKNTPLYLLKFIITDALLVDKKNTLLEAL